MNRNMLKIIAVITMLIDHIGYFLMDNNIIMRIIGRLAFPIFAFFIAEGMKYTRSRKRYILTLLIFALVSQIPYGFLCGFYKLNILFTFIIAIILILLIENYNKTPLFSTAFFTLITLVTFIAGFFGVIDYGIFGVGLVLVFYFIKNGWLKYLLSAGVLILLVLFQILVYGVNAYNIIGLFALVSLLVLLLYNGQKGRVNLKYLFYIFYPLHLIVILCIGLII